MVELNDFYNEGLGWVCRRCERELQQADTEPHSRLMREGEAESKQPQLSHTALAKWADKTHQTLICPRCGVTEPVEK
jgi:hypothetical protein